MNRLGTISVIAFGAYTLAWAAAWWLMTRERPAAPTKYHSTPIDITTPEERARGERSFEIAREHTIGVTRTGLFTLIAFGYFVLGMIFLIAFIKSRPSAA